MKEININKNDSNQRIDKFLIKYFDNLPKSLIYKWIRTKKIKVNNKKILQNYFLVENDKIQIFVNGDLLIKSQPKIKLLHKPIHIVYEDNNILLVDKPVGLIVHNDINETNDTLINRVINYLINNKEYDPKLENSFVPALCNRLDRNTQGLVIIAKNAESLRILNEKIKNREITKMYLAMVHGKIKKKNDHLVNFLFKNQKENKVYISNVKKTDNVEIITDYKLIKYVGNNSLLEINLITGKTHQIRAHLSYIGHPIIGDQKYALISEYSKEKLNKQMLCAYKLRFDFKTSAGILNYLKNKTFEIKNIWFLYNKKSK